MSELNVDLYWSFRSPFSYIVLRDLKAMMARYMVRVTAKPVYPLIIRVPDYFKKADPRFFPYLLKDAARTAQMEGIPFAPADPDPIVMDTVNRIAAPDQPYIYRLNRIAAAASLKGEIFPLIDRLGTLIWSGQTQGWHKEQHLGKAVSAAGFDLKTLDEQAAENPQKLDDILAANQVDLEAAGHWGVPTLVFNDEPFFGHDRVAMLIWRLKQHGLKER